MLSIMFDGHNHAVCKAFLGDNFDNTLDYPNAKTANGFEEVFKGDLIQEDENGSIAIIHPTDNPDGTTDAEEKVTITKTEYAQLVSDSEFLYALEAAGVDGWSGYEIAQDSLE